MLDRQAALYKMIGTGMRATDRNVPCLSQMEMFPFRDTGLAGAEPPRRGCSKGQLHTLSWGVLASREAAMISILLAAVLSLPPYPALSPTEGEALQPDPDEAPVVKLTLPPSKLPPRALRYPLLPELRDTTPGNAAPLYLRAFSPDWYTLNKGPDAIDFLTMPLDELRNVPREQLPAVFSNSLKEVDRAARREYCDWDMTRRLREEGLGMLLPEIQAMRRFATGLALRAKLEMADGNKDKAIHTLQTGFALGRHVADGPTVIQALVGMALCQVMLERVEELMQLPDAPNLYWSLTDLPRPLIDLRKPLQGEKINVDHLFPGLRELANDPDLKPLSNEKLEELMDKYARALRVMADESEPEWKLKLGTKVMAGLGHANAKKFLIAQGFAADKVEKLPAVQASLYHAILEHDRLYDEMLKWQNLPYHEAVPGYAELDRELKNLKMQHIGIGAARDVPTGLPLASMLMPAFLRARIAQERVDRKVALLRTIEAIRLHAAANGGKLPAKLEDIKAVPLPIDPLTGKPFDYEAEGNKATLIGPPSPGERSNQTNTLKYELTLK
jgi:hypothetical protein